MVLENLNPILNLSAIFICNTPGFKKRQKGEVRAGHERSGRRRKSRPQQQTGQNAGLSVDIRDSAAPVTTGGVSTVPYMQLMEMMPNPIEPGDVFIATVGCGKTRYACQEFNNMDNHLAFPDMPTEERALATPNISNQGYSPKQTK